MSDTQEKLRRAMMTGPNRWAEATINGKLVSYYEIHDETILLDLIDSAKREVLEEMRPANATIESMRIYTPRTHTYMGKEYPACGICGFCPEAMNAFIDAQLEQSEESE